MKAGLSATILAIAIGVSLAACSGTNSGNSGSGAQESTTTSITQSPDKYTWYINNYVGMNAASVGYEALDGFRHDAYGDSTVKIIYVSSDGTYIDPSNEDQLKDYVVVGQNIDPNTAMKYEYAVDSEGEEYDNLVEFQSIDEIVLAVEKTGADSSSARELTQIQPSPDKYTYYVRDYVGRNLAECGYYSLSGNLTDAYGDGYIYFDIVADDGAYIDPEDEASLAGYMVTSQSVDPNTMISMSYSTDSEGNEYQNLIDTQSVETIRLDVTKAPESGYQIGDADESDAAPTEDIVDLEEDDDVKSSSTNVRELLDTYEAFIDEYVDFMITYKDSDDVSGMLTDYADIVARYSDLSEQIDDIDESSLSADDYAYYIEVLGRVTERLKELE